MGLVFKLIMEIDIIIKFFYNNFEIEIIFKTNLKDEFLWRMIQ
ncbi:hypothetical protein QE429_003742 [Bacillus sp. SORGH_AS 510]|nr:hypothetical protein [Bacillus sp. SORGH_AS_0510]